MNNFFRRAGWITAVVFIISFSFTGTSLAASARLTIDWDTFSVDLYDLSLIGTPPSAQPFYEDWQNVNADFNGDYDSNDGYDWTPIIAEAGTAAGMATADMMSPLLTTEISIEAGDTAFASLYRSGSVTSDPGLLKISVDYSWMLDTPASNSDDLYGWFWIDAGYGNQWFHHFVDVDATLGSEYSGSLALYLAVDDPYEPVFFSVGLDLSGSIDASPVVTPVPSSAILFFSGLFGLVMLKRENSFQS